MTLFRRILSRPARVLALSLALLAPAAHAQEDAQTAEDRSFVTGFLEENLSGAGRTVTLRGFQGALSSRATFESLSIADDDGVWITLRGGAIQWNRRALLARRVEIAELSAEEIEFPRLPHGEGEGRTAEAPEFSLPSLPVGIRIEDISAERVIIGPEVFGAAATVSVKGAMVLSGGAGEARLAVERRDDRRGSFQLHAGFANDTRVLKTDLVLDEDEDGILANLIGLHGRPSLHAEIKGEGPLSDFTADISLATDGQPRVEGQVGLTGEAGADGGTDHGFRVRLGGDIGALLPENRRAFFGNDSNLLVQGTRGADGSLSVPVMLIGTAALNLSGGFELAAGGAPQSASLLMTLGEEAGATELPVRLPFGEAATTVQTGRLQLSYDHAEGDGWTLTGVLGDVRQPDLTIAALDLDGGGTVRLDGESLSGIDGRIALGARGLAPADPGLAAALGDAVTLATNFDLRAGDALELAGLALEGADYRLAGDVVLDGLSSGITASGRLDAEYADLGRLSTLAGRDVTGALTGEVEGSFTLLTGGFDMDATVTGHDITVDQPELDRLLAGEAAITASVRRDQDGITVEDVTIDSQRLSAHAQGTVSSEASDLRAVLDLDSLATVDPGIGGALRVEAGMTGASGARRLVVNGEAIDLQTGISHLDAALSGQTELRVAVQQGEGGFAVETLDLSNPQLTLRGDGNLMPGQMDARIALEVPSLTSFDPGWGGSLSLRGTVVDGSEGDRRFELTGNGEGLAIGDPRVDGMLAGVTRLDLRGTQAGEAVMLERASLANPQVSIDASGIYAPGRTALNGNVSLPSLRVMGPGYGGSVALTGSVSEGEGGAHDIVVDGTIRDLSLAQNGAGASLAGDSRVTLRAQENAGTVTLQTAEIDNPRLRAQASGRVGAGDTDLTASLRADSLAFLGRGLRGGITLDARLLDDGSTQAVTATGEGRGLGIGNAQLDPLLAGVTRLDLDATRSGQQITVRRAEVANGQLRLTASGDLDSAIRVNARLNDLGLLVREFPGPVTAEGTLTRAGSNIGVDLRATGPGALRAQVSGTVAQDVSTMNLNATGSVESAVANPFLRVRSVQGPVNFDISVNGRPGIEAVGGRVSLVGASLADPKLGLRIDGLGLDARFDRGRIAIEGAGNVAAGGRVAVNGAISVTGARPVDLVVDIQDVVMRDPNLYITHANGQVTINGQLADGPLIAGTIRLSDTELRIPSTGLGGAKDIPFIHHVGDTRPVRATRAKAGLIPWPSEDSAAAGMAGPAATPPAIPARLDLTIDAPTQIFIRGRGVDAELGGSLRLTGRINNVVPIGMFQLIRGRVDLLGKRFDLTEGLLEMQGSMIPVIRLVAQTEQDGITTRIIIDGDARDPEITFSSDPDMPQEEVLSQLLFGRGLDRITPLQAAQLANAVAVLAGRGGSGIVGRLRESVGLDDLDLATDDEGNVTVRAGKYLSENVYTDVAVGSDGTSTIQINLDITPELTARGSIDSAGTSAIGLFYERDF